jgi:hypothetical protein
MIVALMVDTLGLKGKDCDVSCMDVINGGGEMGTENSDGDGKRLRLGEYSGDELYRWDQEAVGNQVLKVVTARDYKGGYENA